MAVTLKDVAARAKLSQTTVSLILNNKPVRVSAHKREQVFSIAKELNYKPNQLAKSLITKNSMTIGIIVPDIKNIFYSQLIDLIIPKLKDRNYNLILSTNNNNENDDIEQLEFLRTRQVSGVIIIFSNTMSERYIDVFNKFNQDNIPIILMDRFHEGFSDIPYIGVNNEYGGYLATKYLIDCNHKNIACIKGNILSDSSRKRYNGYIKALNEAGIPLNDNYVFQGNYKFESGEQLASEIVKHPEITAVFASNDMMALGLYRGLSAYGKRVGQDISIVGFDDIIFSSMLETPLTTINTEIDKIADATIGLLMAKINSEEIKEQYHIINPRLIVRDSVKILEKQ